MGKKNLRLVGTLRETNVTKREILVALLSAGCPTRQRVKISMVHACAMAPLLSKSR